MTLGAQASMKSVDSQSINLLRPLDWWYSAVALFSDSTKKDDMVLGGKSRRSLRDNTSSTLAING